LTPKVSMEELKRANLKRSTSTRRSYMGMGPMRGNSVGSLLPVPETSRLGIGLSPLGGSGNLGSRALQHSMTGSFQSNATLPGMLPGDFSSNSQQISARPASLSRSATFAGRGSAAAMPAGNPLSALGGVQQQQHQQLVTTEPASHLGPVGTCQGSLPAGMPTIGSSLLPTAASQPFGSAPPSGPPALGSLRRMASRRGAYPGWCMSQAAQQSATPA
jgi:hypothetical protein